ncbi:hypothetical protein HXX76_006909 [Chlamydomonas incerta]|uniref:glycerophosphodiester phosphodiesterase n=1 Tax=Chlamydomonas incerta TaxID=51695 RepID=A0A835TCJ9_CHLIN|nr:hypothetical protein HXX76_006909 [Chlamydomonas incerta]|eukprot:KAG2435711.1 hypothetical protein HXX76_006909 [Chlamydomonas incerta]
MEYSRAATATVLVVLALVSQAQAGVWPRSRPYNIAHRGASGFRPDHTAEGYQLAIDLGADFIECDVVLTKDLVPVCRHEPLVSGTTDADAKFPNLIKSIIIDGANYTGVFTTDLTLAEVKTLRCKQPIADRDQSFNGLFAIPTLEEYIAIAKRANRTIGIYPETKHPTWHDSLPIVKAAQTTMSDIVLNVLKKHGYKGPINSKAWSKQPVFIQSFEVGNLKYLSRKTCIPLVQLLSDWNTPIPDMPALNYSSIMSEAGVKDMATYASGVGPWKNTLVRAKAGANVTANGAALESTGLAERIRKNGMQAHPYTFRNEARYLTYGAFATAMDEFEFFFVKLGLEGAFTDYTGSLRQYFTMKSQEQGRLWNTGAVINRAGRPKPHNPKC